MVSSLSLKHEVVGSRLTFYKKKIALNSVTVIQEKLQCCSKYSHNPKVRRVPTQPGKPGIPGKIRVYLENLELSWNFVKFNQNP